MSDRGVDWDKLALIPDERIAKASRDRLLKMAASVGLTPLLEAELSEFDGDILNPGNVRRAFRSLWHSAQRYVEEEKAVKRETTEHEKSWTTWHKRIREVAGEGKVIKALKLPWCNVHKMDYGLFQDAIEESQDWPLRQAFFLFIEAAKRTADDYLEFRSISGGFSRKVTKFQESPDISLGLTKALTSMSEVLSRYKAHLTNQGWLAESLLAGLAQASPAVREAWKSNFVPCLFA